MHEKGTPHEQTTVDFQAIRRKHKLPVRRKKMIVLQRVKAYL